MHFVNIRPFQPLRLLLAGILLALAFPAAAQTVVLDPGHGGKDRGTSWGGVSEKTLTLSISRKVAARLQASGIRTVLTRNSDRYVSLPGRAAVANGFRNACFVSIHCNAEISASVRGIETFYYGSRGSSLASAIHRRLDTHTSTPSRGVKFGHFAVLRQTSCPAALVECGFVSHRRERNLLISPIYQEKIATAIADGIRANIRNRSASYTSTR